MGIEFNRTDKLNEIKIGKELPGSKQAEKQEKTVEQEQIFDNKFKKEVGENLLTANAASAYGVKLNKVEGEKIDTAFWGDALKGLKLKDTSISANTKQVINDIDNTFALIDMQSKMEASPFMKALNKEFDIS